MNKLLPRNLKTSKKKKKRTTKNYNLYKKYYNAN